MSNKPYQMPVDVQNTVNEPVVAYQRRPSSVRNSSSDKWNPNVPFHCTQEEFLEHIHRIEQGEFMTIEEADREFEAWRKDFLASRM
jgi:hypothetical protein